MGKRRTQTEQTRENLKTAFWELYRQKPLEQITVREVTDLAGYNRGTFYVYFKDVYDVLEQTEREIMQVFSGEDAFAFNPQDREHFAETIRFFIRFIEEHSGYLMLLAGERGIPGSCGRCKIMSSRRSPPGCAPTASWRSRSFTMWSAP